jgi:hypothetical protein
MYYNSPYCSLALIIITCITYATLSDLAIIINHCQSLCCIASVLLHYNLPSSQWCCNAGPFAMQPHPTPSSIHSCYNALFCYPIIIPSLLLICFCITLLSHCNLSSHCNTSCCSPIITCPPIAILHTALVITCPPVSMLHAALPL